MMVFVFIPCFSLLKGQTYYPFVKDSAGWSWEYASFDGMYWMYDQGKFVTYGDTVINSNTYKKVYSQITNRDFYDMTNIAYYGAMREDSTKKVWYIGNAIDCQDTIEILLYDFGLSISDTIITVCNQWTDTIRTNIIEIDSVLIQNQYRNRWRYDTDNIGDGYWIEGIGSTESLFGHLHSSFESSYWLTCYHEGDSLVYKAIPNGNCNWADGISESNMHEYIDIYPNPFTTSTTLRMEGLNGQATLQLYDQLGRQVRLFNIPARPAGGHHSTFNIPRRGLPSGIYFYRLQSRQGLLGTGKLVAVD